MTQGEVGMQNIEKHKQYHHCDRQPRTRMVWSGRERDAQDRRVIHVHLTEAGPRRLKRCFHGHVTALVEEFSVLSASEQQTLGELCKKLGKGRESNKVQIKN